VPLEITVLGGGSSLRGRDLSQLPGLVIGVNDAAYHRPCDIAVSMDRLWTENRWVWLRDRAGRTWLRRSAVKNCPERWEGLQIFECNHEAVALSPCDGVLNGTNSGFCAINLAVQMRPARIYLYGMDLGRGPAGEAYWYPPYPWAKPQGGTADGRYAAWAQQLKTIAAQCAAAGIELIRA
jgi:hypothetical protein